MKKIIVADDSEIVKGIICKALNNEYELIKASNGKDVVDSIINDKNKEIVGLLLDLNMPNYDGFYVLNYFKNNNLFKRIPVSIISGDDTKETINKAFSYEIVDMLNKPFGVDNIKSVIEKMTLNKR